MYKAKSFLQYKWPIVSLERACASSDSGDARGDGCFVFRPHSSPAQKFALHTCAPAKLYVDLQKIDDDGGLKHSTK
jgi:hypothetical protein